MAWPSMSDAELSSFMELFLVFPADSTPIPERSLDPLGLYESVHMFGGIKRRRRSRSAMTTFGLRGGWHFGSAPLVVQVGLLVLFGLQVTGCFGFVNPSDSFGLQAHRPRHESPRCRTVSATPSASTDASTTAAPQSDPTYTRVVGNWEELHGNFLLRPSIESGSPRALIHFLGGAIVGASPHISYRYLLERLAERGYLVVATPYSLSFDHLSTCDAVIARFERIAPLLARTYGPLPVVGIGHSCGALLQLLICSVFPDTPRAANALLSFNNKPVSDAVPLFNELVAPFFTYAAARNETSRNSGSELISVGLLLAKEAANGRVPPDDLLARAWQLLLPPGLETGPSSSGGTGCTVPSAVREAYARLAGPSVAALSQSGALPLFTETLETLEQIPRLIDEVADGAREFIPAPDKVKAAARRACKCILHSSRESWDCPSVAFSHLRTVSPSWCV